MGGIVGPGRVSLDEDDRIHHGKDAFSHHEGPPPSVVVYPATTEHVSAILRVCHAHKVPVIPYGGGTSLEGHTNVMSSSLECDCASALRPESRVPVPSTTSSSSSSSSTRGVVSLDLSRMDKVLELNVEDGDVTVEAGVRWEWLNEFLRPHGLFFAVDPGPGATIGGMCGTGCSGTNAVRFGTMRDNVLRLKVVLADGRVITTRSRARKSSAGYDLTRLLIGSEGTLGVVTEATLRLRPLPEKTAVAVCAFPTVHAAATAAHRLLQQGVQVQCVELLDEWMIRALNAQSGFAYPEKPHLFFKFAGTTAQVDDDAKRTATISAALGGEALRFAEDAAGQKRLWEARKVALWSASAMRAGARVAITDVCVPLSSLADAIVATQTDIAASRLAGFAPIVGHVGDGNFHVFLTFDPSNPAEVAEAEALNARMVRRAIAVGGTCTGEHGVGVGKRHFLVEELGPGALGVMKQLKRALDPSDQLNPGKIFLCDKDIAFHLAERAAGREGLGAPHGDALGPAWSAEGAR